MLGLNETIDRLAIAKSVPWYYHVLWIEHGHALRRALGFEIEGQRKKCMVRKTWKNQIEEESLKVCLSMEDLPCQL